MLQAEHVSLSPDLEAMLSQLTTNAQCHLGDKRARNISSPNARRFNGLTMRLGRDEVIDLYLPVLNEHSPLSLTRT